VGPTHQPSRLGRGLKYEGFLLELDVLFERYEMETSLQKLYEGCDLGAIAGDALRLPGPSFLGS